MTIIRIGLDTSKHVFEIHGVDENEQPVLRRQNLVKLFAKLAPTPIAMEACGAAHHWARVLRGLGHEVVLIPPQYIKPYVQRGKNDKIRACPRAGRRPDPGAEAICGQIDGLNATLKAIEARIMAWHKQNQKSQLLATVPGIGRIGGVSFALRVPQPKVFRLGRQFAAWIGITPRENSTAGRRQLGRISKQSLPLA
jgi:transposase